MTLEKKEKAPLTDEQVAVKEANRQKAAIYKERRIALGLSQKQLAQKTGVSYNSIQGMETGKMIRSCPDCVMDAARLAEGILLENAKSSVTESKKTIS